LTGISFGEMSLGSVPGSHEDTEATAGPSPRLPPSRVNARLPPPPLTKFPSATRRRGCNQQVALQFARRRSSTVASTHRPSPATGQAIDRAIRKATPEATLPAIWRAMVTATGRATRTATQTAMVGATGRATDTAARRATGKAIWQATGTATGRATRAAMV
jgi:hypothetical protein